MLSLLVMNRSEKYRNLDLFSLQVEHEGFLSVQLHHDLGNLYIQVRSRLIAKSVQLGFQERSARKSLVFATLLELVKVKCHYCAPVI